jgi:dTMP kinase
LNLFITFEGPEGSGKTTQLHRLAAYLREQGHDLLTTREPGGSAIGDQIRAIVLDPDHTEMVAAAEFLLFSASRAQHVAQVIAPHLARGGTVLCDRYADASLAYQGYGQQLDLQALQAITTFATRGLVPDITFYLDVPAELGLRRKEGGDGDAWNRMEQQALAFHRRVRQGYLAMIDREPARWVQIDATQDPQQVQADIRAALRARQALQAATVRENRPG